MHLDRSRRLGAYLHGDDWIRLELHRLYTRIVLPIMARVQMVVDRP